MKKLLTIGLVSVSILAGSTVAMGANLAKTPAEILADLKGVSVEQVYEERQSGETYGQMANDIGEFDTFQQEMEENMKSILEERVKEGLITQEEADLWLEQMEERMDTCYGSGAGMGYGRGYGMGQGMGYGRGYGMGQGMGYGRGYGMGQGMGYGRGYGMGQGMGYRNYR